MRIQNIIMCKKEINKYWRVFQLHIKEIPKKIHWKTNSQQLFDAQGNLYIYILYIHRYFMLYLMI